MRGHGGGPKPWKQVFEWMLQGYLPFAIQSPEEGIRRLLVPTHSCNIIWNLGSGRGLQDYTQEEALEILNLSVKQGSALIPFRTRTPLKRNPSFAAATVERLAAERISSREIMARTRLRYEEMTEILKQRSCHRVDALGWDRAELIRAAPDLI
jgi:hypothetical protein